MEPQLPRTDPFALCALDAEPPRIAARKDVVVFDAPAAAILLPDRAGRPGLERPAFRTARAETILRNETRWSDGAVALTANRYPFAERHVVLWSCAAVREADERLLAAAFALAARVDGTALLNTIGAAATIAHAHVHVIGERSTFLPAVSPWVPFAVPLDANDAPGVATTRADAAGAPLIVQLRGNVLARARACARLLQLRGTAAINVVADADATWLFPRGPVETPAPEFPFALGAAEVFGRFCFSTEPAFAAADGPAMERALTRAGIPVPDGA